MSRVWILKTIGSLWFALSNKLRFISENQRKIKNQKINFIRSHRINGFVCHSVNRFGGRELAIDGKIQMNKRLISTIYQIDGQSHANRQ